METASRSDREAVSEYMSRIGKRGGKARKKALTSKRRREIAVNAIRTRWAREKAKKK